MSGIMGMVAALAAKGDFSNYEGCALKIPYERIDDPSRTFCMGFKPKSMAFLEAFRDWGDKREDGADDGTGKA